MRHVAAAAASATQQPMKELEATRGIEQVLVE